MDLVTMVKTVCRYFLSARNKEANIGNIKKNSSNFEQRERKYANTWGGGGRPRCQKSLQNFSTTFSYQNVVKNTQLICLGT